MPTSSIQANTRLAMYAPDPFFGTAALIFIFDLSSFTTNTGSVLPGSPSCPRKQKSMTTSGIVPASFFVMCGLGRPRPMAQSRHQLRYGRCVFWCSSLSSSDGSPGSCILLVDLASTPPSSTSLSSPSPTSHTPQYSGLMVSSPMISLLTPAG